MDGFFTILIKTNVMLAVLCLLYLVLFRKDTFFSWRRISLLLIYAFVAICPLASNIKWSVEPPMAGSVDEGIRAVWTQAVEVGANVGESAFDIKSVIIYIWLAISAMLTMRFLWQLGTICWLAWKSKAGVVDGVHIRQTDVKGSPFSFFRWIFIHQEMLTRYAKLDIAPYKGFVNPIYTPVYDSNGKLVDVKVSYTENYRCRCR